MRTVEMRNTDITLYGNGLIARGYVRESVDHANRPESAIRSWSYGLGRGISSLTPRQTTWSQIELQAGEVR